MPFRNSYIASSSLSSLSEIIKLEPEQEPWCAGYAPSQGRRCHVRTNARGRRSATMLLNEGTKYLLADRSIDALLEDLAPHVLCTRFHQGQALDLACRWKRQVRQYLDSQVAATPFPRPVRVSTRTASSEAAEANARIAALEQRLLEAMEKVRHLELAQQGLSTMANPSSSSQSRDTSAVVRSSSTETAPSRNTPTLNHVDTTVTTESTEPTGQPAITVPRPAQLQASQETMAISALSPSPVTPLLVVSVSSSTEQEVSQEETSQTNRRLIEGECGICLCDFHVPHQDVDGDEEGETEHSHVDEYDDDKEDYDDDDNYEYDEQTEAEDVHEYQDEELVWCKARCGINFHKRCIDQWLETDHAPTCPACRSKWEH